MRCLYGFVAVNFSNGQLVNGSKKLIVTAYTKIKDKTKRKKILVS